MPDPEDAPQFDPPDADLVYQRYRETYRRLGIEQVSRERATGPMEAWTEALSGRPDPTQHLRALCVGLSGVSSMAFRM